ncbi:uncharacterized protein LOC121424434 [Lytechinus variegatus]|uniref:uncharacterized protein LOC121424434 n=1 Tax=Lytechinus variegatus TaxID=7654 RepID=UPI001BB26F56|nr:uncharacterized protein LOC121424434 [Lytechinus variegatus]
MDTTRLNYKAIIRENNTSSNLSLRMDRFWATLILVYILNFSKLLDGEVLHITVLTIGHTAIETTNNVQYQCYSSEPDRDASLSFGRSAPITTNIQPPRDEDHSTVYQFVRVVRFHQDDRWLSDGFGPFFCEASKLDREVTRITTFFQRNDAKFRSSEGIFTKTVNVLDVGVIIPIEARYPPDASGNAITWRKDGSDILTQFEGQAQISFPNPIQISDRGIYEIYYDGERSQNRGGIYRLIVRECPAGKWGPPQCYGICDNCYNGGVCDDKSGLCICPNNFKGDNCLHVCRDDGGNRFGLNCEFQCSYNTDGRTRCHGKLFCLPDPYGCSCDVGAHGPECNTPCSAGRYGPGCSQMCHCAGGASCNIFSGTCRAGCQSGWSGNNCQIPDVCKDGYYGSQCIDKCHCLNNLPCNKRTGQCLWMKCDIGYHVRSGRVKCDVLPVLENAPTIVSISPTTVGLEWDPWSAEDHLGVTNLIGYDVFVKKEGDDWGKDQRVNRFATSATVIDLVPDTEYSFSVAAVREGDGGTGPLSHPLIGPTTLCIEPSASPTGLQVEASRPKELQVIWEHVPIESVNCRSGVTFYKIYYSPSGSPASNSSMVSSDVNNYTITGLDTFLEYTIQISAWNKDKESKKRTERVGKTLEEVAPAPINVTVPRSTPSSFTVTWATPLPSNLNGNIQKYKVRYQQTDPSVEGVHNMEDIMMNLIRGEYTVTDLPAETNYSVQIQTVNGAGSSNWSEPVNAKTVYSGGYVPSIELLIWCVVAFLGILLVFIIVIVIVRRRGNRTCRGQATATAKQTDFSTVTYEVEETDNTYNEVSYDGLSVNHAYKEDLPLVTRPSSKQPIKPSLKPEKSKGSPITMVTSLLPACPERLDKKEVSSPKPNPFVLCEKEKFRNMGNDDVNIDMRKKIETPVQSRRQENIVSPEVMWDRTRIQENLGKGGTEEGDTGDIYQDVTIPAMVSVSELEIYIKRKTNGKINELANEFDLISAEQLHPWNVASKEKNKAKNRFRNILAYDHSRVVLKKVDGDPHSDYYNANYINDFRGERTFIASQAPNTASLTAFWRMIWQENVATIVMLTKLMEAGKDRCRQYWPKNPGTVEVIGDFSLTLMEVEQFSDHTVRTVIVKMAEQGVDVGGVEERRTITQYHYTSWPDMGVPEYYTTLISFSKSVKQHHKRVQSTGRTSPLLVHCCAGVGRTGTFLCLYNMLDMMKEECGVDIFGFISRMRDNRFKMVQKKGQYVFLYNALLEAYLSGDTEIPAVKFREVMDTAQSGISATKRESIHLEFETLRKVNPSPPTNSFRSGRASSNQRKNRFPDVLPLESNRPYLLCRGLEDSTDYINASFINTFLKRNVLLATQSPLPNTVVDLWRLVIDRKCPVIVMLNELDGESCVQYWPEEESIAFGPLEVTALESGLSTVNFVKRKFGVTSDTGQCINVEQFQMRGWGLSNDKPDSPLSLIKLIEAVEGSIEKAESKGPAIVHCINGIGRSGVFCALWSVFEKLRKEDNVDIFQAVQRLRSNRPRMVESLEQYELCHEVVNEYLHQFEEYANVDTIDDQLPSI